MGPHTCIFFIFFHAGGESPFVGGGFWGVLGGVGGSLPPLFLNRAPQGNDATNITKICTTT